MNIVSVTRDVMMGRWRQPVTIIVNHNGDVFMTEFPTAVETGEQDIVVTKKNSKGFNTFYMKGE